MTTKLKYNGAGPIWGTTIVGKPDRWYPGQIQDVTDADATLYVTANVGFEVVGAAIKPLVSGAGNLTMRSTIALNQKPMAVMASAPAISTSTTNSLSAGQAWRAPNIAGTLPTSSVNAGVFGLSRSAYWRQLGAINPDYDFITAQTVTQASTPAYGNLSSQISVLHTGSALSVMMKGIAPSVLIKVNGEFTSLTPITTPNDGGRYYINIDFGSTDERRIDIIGYNLAFGGIYTGLTDVLRPATRRGRKMVVMADSFGEGTGNETSALLSWIFYLTEWLGWDDVIASAVGSTGLITGSAPKVNFQTRVARDVGALGGVDILWVCQSTNDNGQSGAAITAAAAQLVANATAGGFAGRFVFSSPTITRGAGSVSVWARQQDRAMKAWCAANGYLYVDDIEMPLDSNVTPQVTTITSSVAANATSVVTALDLIQGATYRFDDGTTFFVRSKAAASTFTVDKVAVAQSSGATITQTGSCYLTGTGRVGATAGWGVSDLAVSSDDIHPSNLGHKLKGSTDAHLFARLLNAT